jgi:hypothetical protein
MERTLIVIHDSFTWTLYYASLIMANHLFMAVVNNKTTTAEIT